MKERALYLVLELGLLTIFLMLWVRCQRLEIAVAGCTLLLFVFTLFFFRDPERTITTDDTAILAPADGKVIGIEENEEFQAFPGASKRVSIYLSLWDVHVNRMPVSGCIKLVKHVPGKFYAAFRDQSSEKNEHTIIGIETTRGVVYVRQIAGILARRIVCRVRKDQKMHQGERYGMIRFGSRVELYLPGNVTLSVRTGEHVRAGEAVVGRFLS